MCIADWKLLYSVLKFAQHQFWCLPSHPFWLQACIILQLTVFHRQYKGQPHYRVLNSLTPLDFSQFLIILWMIKKALPNNYSRNSSPCLLCGQTVVVLCPLHFRSLETSCFSHRGLALAARLLTSTSFGYGCWPVAGFRSTFDLPYRCSQQMLVQQFGLCTTDKLCWLQKQQCKSNQA